MVSVTVCGKLTFLDQESSFNLNLMTLDAESLNIPATTYSSQIVLPSGDFARTCKELSQLSENGKNFTLGTFLDEMKILEFELDGLKFRNSE